MKRILIILFLILPLYLSGQKVITSVTYSQITVEAGENMISNGTFVDATDWSVTGSWSITGGVAAFADITAGLLTQAAADMVTPFVVSTSYNLQFDIVSTGTANLGISNTTGNYPYLAAADYGNGHHSVTITTPANYYGEDQGLAFDCSAGGTTATFTIDNVVITAL